MRDGVTLSIIGWAHTQNDPWCHPGCNKVNPGYFPLAATALKPQQIHIFLHIAARVWGVPVIVTDIRTVGLCVKTAIILKWKFLCIPDCTYIESMLINFIQMSLRNISLMQAILYQFKRDVAAWKRLKSLQLIWRLSTRRWILLVPNLQITGLMVKLCWRYQSWPLRQRNELQWLDKDEKVLGD